MLLTARNYRGEQLRERGVAFTVLPSAQVCGHALQLAGELAQMPRESLVLLKRHLGEPLRAQLPDCIDKELTMHSRTFHSPEVRQRIASLFGN
jgi:polyketide biosynthesis enoyl-CoA hydratase PksI